MYYTQEQIDRANQADIVSFLQSQGEQLKGLVLSRNQILDEVWGYDCDVIDRTIDAYAECGGFPRGSFAGGGYIAGPTQ